ncbi:PPC domain-containing DNA-binding protein [Bacillus mesophilum]|uniref:DNA-binding protein n=1 Tax=Bacillus mesophilum TaxID=1071718 RepID=A0A7V7UU30_9BACI|nr:PPC domain-containing DNA-binding protein [Bacillus mesophilum]KAB2331052.1 DNA-binding protein [Bacillus mesophilum]
MVKVQVQRTSRSVFDQKRGIIMGYLAPGEDLLGGIKKACERHGVKSGSLSCIGSLSNIEIVQLDYNDGEMVYSKPIQWNTPVELLSGNGFIGVDEQGDLDIHFHGVFVDHRKNVSGGHFLEGKTIVAITLEFTIIVAEGIQPVRETYQPSGFSLFNFYDESEA